jgi:hypothetical protein
LTSSIPSDDGETSDIKIESNVVNEGRWNFTSGKMKKRDDLKKNIGIMFEKKAKRERGERMEGKT